MQKTTGLSRAIAVLLLVLLTIGIGGYIVPRLAQLSSGETVDWHLDLGLADTTVSPFEEQALLQRLYAEELQRDIVTSLERITGIGTVKATVLVQLELTRERINKQKLFHKIKFRKWTNSTGSLVKKVSVSVLIDGQMVADKLGHRIYQPRTKTEMQQYTNLVKTIVGFSEIRGDKIEVVNLPFVERKPIFLGVPLSLWVNGFYFLVFVVLMMGLVVGFVLPVLRSLLRPDEGVVMPATPQLLYRVEEMCRQSPERAATVIQRALEQTSSEGNSRHYKPADEVAMILLVLNRTVARDICRYLSAGELRRLGRLTERLGNVPRADIQKALERFIHDFDIPLGIRGVPETARAFLQDVHPEGKRLYTEMRLTDKGATIWERLEQLEIGELSTFLQQQKPETAALILCALSDEKAGQILTVLPTDFGGHILVHLTHLKRIRPDMRDKLSAEIAPAVYELLQHRREASGADRIAAIMKTITEKEREKLMTAVGKTERGADQNVRICLKRWEDILTLSDEAMHQLLKYCDKAIMAMALSDLPTDIREHFARYMTPAEWQTVQQKMTRSVGPEAGAARATILKTARELNLFG